MVRGTRDHTASRARVGIRTRARARHRRRDHARSDSVHATDRRLGSISHAGERTVPRRRRMSSRARSFRRRRLAGRASGAFVGETHMTFHRTVESYQTGAPTMPRERYTSDGDSRGRARAHLRARVELCRPRRAACVKPGDFIVRNIAGESIIILRDRGGELRAFFNVCRHRGTQLCNVDVGQVLRDDSVSVSRLDLFDRRTADRRAAHAGRRGIRQARLSAAQRGASPNGKGSSSSTSLMIRRRSSVRLRRCCAGSSAFIWAVWWSGTA